MRSEVSARVIQLLPDVRFACDCSRRLLIHHYLRWFYDIDIWRKIEVILTGIHSQLLTLLTEQVQPWSLRDIQAPLQQLMRLQGWYGAYASRRLIIAIEVVA